MKGQHFMGGIRDAFRRQGLVRSAEGVLAGVCAGLGRRFGLRPWPARWLFLIGLLILPGSQLLIYPVLWILMPKAEPTDPGATASTNARRRP